jgi:hypothetical protein
MLKSFGQHNKTNQQSFSEKLLRPKQLQSLKPQPRYLKHGKYCVGLVLGVSIPLVGQQLLFQALQSIEGFFKPFMQANTIHSASPFPATASGISPAG